MSITGYEREKASELAFSENDPKLDSLRQLSADKQMIIVAGAPVLVLPFILQVYFFHPAGCQMLTKRSLTMLTYTK